MAGTADWNLAAEKHQTMNAMQPDHMMADWKIIKELNNGIICAEHDALIVLIREVKEDFPLKAAILIIDQSF